MIVGLRPKYYHTHRDWKLSYALSITPSIFITLIPSLSLSHSHFHTNTSAHQNTQPRPCPSPLGSTRWAKDRIGRHKKEENKGRGVCGEEKEDWCVVGRGWRAFVEKRDDFLLLYVLGLYLTWSSGCLQEQQPWAQHKPGLGELRIKRHRPSNFNSERMNLSVGFLWKVKDVGCNLWSRRHWAQTVLFVALSGGSCCSFVFFKTSLKLPLSAMCTFFGHVWRLRWCHRHMECDVEVLHLQPNYKVGDHLALTSADGSGLQYKWRLSFWLTAAGCADISDVWLIK